MRSHVRFQEHVYTTEKHCESESKMMCEDISSQSLSYRLCTGFQKRRKFHSYNLFIPIFARIMAIRQTSLKERKRIDIREPRRYKVIIHNDEVTTMDFVVRVLREVFFMSPEDAETMMMKVHNEGESVVGIYSYDIARSKVSKAMSMAREEKFPLRLTYEPEL